MIAWLIKSLILGYQRWLSPLKGFSCAHRVLHGGTSCSGYALQILESDGPWRLLSLMHQRFRDCAQANASIRAQLACARIGTIAINSSTEPSPELPPEPPEKSANGAGWDGDQWAEVHYGRDGYDEAGPRVVQNCAEFTFASPRGCCWHL